MKTLAALFIALFPTIALASVNIDLQPESYRYHVNDEVRIGLYLSSKTNQAAIAADVVFTWDNTKLQFLGIDNTGGPSVTYCGLPSQSSLNEANPPADGNAFLQLLGEFGNPIVATSTGTFITTLRFRAIAATDGTTVSVIPQGWNGQVSRVLDGYIPNFNITGALGSAQVFIKE